METASPPQPSVNVEEYERRFPGCSAGAPGHHLPLRRTTAGGRKSQRRTRRRCGHAVAYPRLADARAAAWAKSSLPATRAYREVALKKSNRAALTTPQPQPFPARGGDHRQAGTSRRRAGLRPRPSGRRPAVSTRCVFIRGETLRKPPSASRGPSGPGDPAGNSRQLLGRFIRRLQRDRLRPQPGRPPPRFQAGQHHARQLRRNTGRRLGIGPDGRAEAADGGTPGDTAIAPIDAELTQAGSVIGTPAYMSPEQADGRRDRIGPPATFTASAPRFMYC